MNKVSVSMQNCFGIKKLNQEFDFTKKNTFVIYAINGTMKSSFARSFQFFQNGKQEEIKDKIYNINGNFQLKIDAIDAKSEQVFVINSFDNDYEADISNLLIDRELSKKLKRIYILRNKFLDKLINMSSYKFDTNLTKDEKYLELEKVILNDFQSDKDNILSLLVDIKDIIPEENYSLISYSIIFDRTIQEKVKEEFFQSKIEDYLKMTETVYSNYSFLKKGALTLPKLKDISKILEKTSFFNSNNKLLLNGQNDEISSRQDLGNKIETIEKTLIQSKEFQQIEKILSTSKGKELKDILELNPDLIKWLKTEKMLELKKILWLSYFQTKEINIKLNELSVEYLNFEKEIENLKTDNTEWERILNIYKTRFSVPYEMKVSNIKNAIIGANIPQIEFRFKDGENEKTLDRKFLKELDTLSQGEKRALYLLNIIFDIEQIKKENKETLFIIDDIADSFDYKNKYAIIEYLCDMVNNPKFKLIILSHNFDFYRTITSRLGLKKANKFIAISNRGSIDLAKSSCDNSPFENWVQNPSDITLLALIPFVRNLIEYKHSTKNEDYLILTDLLHQKEKTHELKLKDVIQIFNKHINSKYITENINGEDKVLNILLKNCDGIKSSNKRIEHKLVLAMGIRHRAEYFMLSTLKSMMSEEEFKTEIEQCKSNQTRFLFDLLKKQSLNNNNLTKYIDILERVNIVTPENIHINAFMYEPIMDMDITELLNLYKKVSELTKGMEYGNNEN